MTSQVRVIVELRVPQSVARSLTAAEQIVGLPQFKIDTRLTPVPIVAVNRIQMSLDAAREQLVLVRGTIDEDQVEQLREHSHVVEVLVDNSIFPFDLDIDMMHCLDFGHRSASELKAFCPIPPCDCNPAKNHGCLLDVAAYLGVDQIWQNGFKGDGVVIGIVDGGITAEIKLDRDTPGLVPRVIGGWPSANWGTLARWDGHGNKMAINALGMAPHAEIYDIRISDSSDCGGCVSDAIAGLQWAIEKYRRDGVPQILSCGWGLYQRLDDPKYATDARHPLTRKVVEAIDEGILVIFAAGNGGESCPLRSCGDDIGPGKSIWGANGHPRVITVGAVNKDEQLIGYSSQGPAALDEYKPDFCGISHFAGYNSCDAGTSSACAVAAGVVALLKQIRPTLTQEGAKRLLKATAKEIGPPGWNRHTGSGIIQAEAAHNQLVGSTTARTVDVARLERLELENHYLKELFVELALEKRIRVGTDPPAG